MRRREKLPAHTETRLRAYALAAAGSGIAVLALAQPSEAEIIYTSADVTITIRKGPTFDLDVNGDGITDFTFGGGVDNANSFYVIGHANGNRVIGLESAGSSGCYASALQAGRGIGRGRLCEENGGAMVFGGVGLWVNVSDRYLGFEFDIDHQEHYGWARLTVRVTDDRVIAHLTGYAYETIANHPLHAGQTSEEDDGDAVNGEPSSAGPFMVLQVAKPGSLGALALGSSHPAEFGR
jgi:hypothetical protein